jgi:hypothetical protein
MPQGAEVKWEGERVPPLLRAAVVLGLRQWAELLLQKSNELVPLDEATLERSGTASVDERELIGQVAYDTPYAVRQHENLDYRHAPGREAKYLEKPWLVSSKWALPLMQKQLRKALKGP